MTGYASLAGETDQFTWDWEARSVNGKGLDLRLRLPDGCEALEPKIRAEAAKHLKRGNISVGLKIRATAKAPSNTLDKSALTAALSVATEVAETAADQGVDLRTSSVADIMSVPGVVVANGEQIDLPVPQIAATIASLVSSLATMRAKEGQKLGAILREQVVVVGDLVGSARKTAEAQAARSGELLRSRIAALMSSSEQLDEGRLNQELAILAVKGDVTEELDRLGAHVAAAEDLLATGGAVGRKLDFLMQEFMREANTLCSKSQSSDLTNVGLSLKVVIDQMREQVQNLE